MQAIGIVPLLAFYTHGTCMHVQICIYISAMYIHDCMRVRMQPFDGRWQSILRYITYSMPVAPVASV